jgi:hypothetical protein
MRVLVGATPTVLGRLEDKQPPGSSSKPMCTRRIAELHATIEGLADGRRCVFPRLYRRRRPSGKPEERGPLFVDADACPHFLAGHRFTCRYCPDPQSIAESLVDVFGVETVVGLPRYTYHDWETRSDWCKQLGPDGVSGPHDDTNTTRGGATTSAWCRSPRPPPAVGGSVAGEEICREVLSVPAPPKPGKLLRESETWVQVSSAAG